MKKYKAATPEETVARIRDILDCHGIPVTCTEKGDGDMFCSYRASITRTGYERIGTNGKGMTPPYAMASAYAEMMERYQNRVVVYPNPVWLTTPCMYFPDETVQTLGKPEVEVLVRKFMPRAYPASGIAETSFECRFIPFYHVRSGELVNLPYSLVRWINGSNGMAAGNIPQEALIQGFNEIFERYALQEMYLRRLTPPDVPMSAFEGTEIIANLERMRTEYGYDYHVKDCSLGEGFPVIALMVYNPDHSKYIIHYGADLNPRVALERCFTEVFQGHTGKTLSFENEMNSCEKLDLFNEFKRSLIYGRGRMPQEFFGTVPSYEYAPERNIPEGRDFSEDLSNIVSWLQDKGYDIYVRDNSFLGFPTYHIVVPGMSDIDKQFCDVNDRIADKQVTENQLNPLWRLPLLDETGLAQAMWLLGKMDTEAVALAPHNLHKSNNVNRHLLMMLISLRTGDDKSALEHVSAYIDSKQKAGKQVPGYYHALKSMLSGEDAKVDDRSVAIARSLMDDRKNVLRTCPLPVCPDCEACELREGCRMEFLKEIESIAQKAMADNQINQRDLCHVFDKA